MIRFDDKGHVVVEYVPYNPEFQRAIIGLPGAKWDHTRWLVPDVHVEYVHEVATRVYPQSPVSEAVVDHIEALGRARERRGATDLPQPAVRKRDSWIHQLRAYHFAKEMPGALLAMEMGTGKTKVAIDLIQNEPRSHTVLIVGPKTVIEGQVWEKQFAEHCAVPYKFLTLGKGNVSVRQGRLEEFLGGGTATEGLRVAAINYEAFRMMTLKLPVDWLIGDEAHMTKSPGGKTSRRMHEYGRHARWKLALTGTPLPHGPMDAYGLFRWLEHGLFGTSFVRFRQRYGILGGYLNRQVVAFQNMEEFEQRMDLITFTADRSALTLPEVMDEVMEVELEPAARKIYKELEKEFLSDLSAARSEAERKDTTVSVSNAMVVGLKLQQVTGGAVKTDSGETVRVSAAKALALGELLEGMGTEPVVVFCRFRSDLDAVHDICKTLKLTSGEVSGRGNDLLSWQAGDSQVLAVQIQAGGVGIDLTRSRYAIYYSLGYSLGDYLQSRARVHRPGQTMPVTNYHLVARKTIDEHVYRALSKRQEVIEEILKEVGR